MAAVLSSSILVLSLLYWALPCYGAVVDDFSDCLRRGKVPLARVFSPPDSSFTTVLNSTAQNLRYLTLSVPRPKLIFTPTHEAHVQRAVVCARDLKLHFRTRSGGHDYEAVSYVSRIENPFVIIDLSQLRSISVDLNSGFAWAQAGATTGEVYYHIAHRSNHTRGFPAGLYTSLGIGGHITGGAYGAMMRKYGLGADNAVDARIVHADGTILDRRSMGEELFWAIRGGGGGSFCIILAWKLKLVPVPATVTVFTVSKTLEQGATKFLLRWQHIAHRIDERLFLRAIVSPVPSALSGRRTFSATFDAVFLGTANQLVRVMRRGFRELSISKLNCTEVRWIESVVRSGGFPPGTQPEILLEGKSAFKNYFKAKSDMVQVPIPKRGLAGLWKILEEEESPLMIWNPYGGRMNSIPASATPFPHRNGTLFKIQYVTTWRDPAKATEHRHVAWIQKLYDYMAPYVSSDPRRAYVNYRDLDLGRNVVGGNTSSWGTSYFQDNFARLKHVKSAVDPHNIFRHEQSIPLLSST